jgi:hypothetical protein
MLLGDNFHVMWGHLCFYRHVLQCELTTRLGLCHCLKQYQTMYGTLVKNTVIVVHMCLVNTLSYPAAFLRMRPEKPKSRVTAGVAR